MKFIDHILSDISRLLNVYVYKNFKKELQNDEENIEGSDNEDINADDQNIINLVRSNNLKWGNLLTVENELVVLPNLKRALYTIITELNDWEFMLLSKLNQLMIINVINESLSLNWPWLIPKSSTRNEFDNLVCFAHVITVSYITIS